MNITTRKLTAALFAAVTLAVPMADQAQAATTKVEIVNKASGRVITSGAGFITAQPSDPSSKLRTWIKVDVLGGDRAIYKWAKNESYCLTALPSSSQLATQLCDGGSRQVWSVGFNTSPFRKFENVGTLRAAAQKPFRNTDGTARTPVEQEVFAAQNSQLWQVRAV
jgi:hypothetical protein